MLRSNATIQYNKLLRLESGLRRSIVREKNRIINIAADYVVDSLPIPEATLRGSHLDMVAYILRKHYEKVIPNFATLIRREVSNLKAIDEFYFQTLVNRFMEDQGFRDVKEIADTTLRDIKRAIQKGTQEGLGAVALGARIRRVSKLSAFRARAIAVTETHNAAMFASMETAKEAQRVSGVQLKKKWVPAADERTRETHREMWGKPAIPISEKFKVRNSFGGFDEMDRPGDPNGSRGNVIRCRCVLVYEEN